MPNTEDFTRAIFSSPQSSAVLRHMETIISAINSPEGRGLLRALGGGGGASLRSAAAGAADAQNAAKFLISALMADPEGSALISQLFAIIGRK